MAKKTLLLILLFSYSISYAANNNITIAVFNFIPLNNISKVESELLSEVVRSELIKSDFLEVIETDQLTQLNKELQFQKTGLSSEAIIKIGKKLKTDYFLFGSVSKINDKIIITSRVISSSTGENIHAKILFSQTKNVITDLPDYSDEIISLILSSTIGNNIKNVERSVDRKEYIIADRRLKIYNKNFGYNKDTVLLQNKINKGLIEYYRNIYNTAIEKNNIKKAYFSAKKMLRLMPQDEESIELYKRLVP